MNRSLFLAAAALMALTLAAPPALAADTPDDPVEARDELDEALEDLVDMKGGPPGAVAVVQRGGRRRVVTAGLADVPERRRIDGDDHMRIASIAKAFSGAVALRLVDRGKLDLDDTIGERITAPPPKWSSVTLRQLLNHTSGLPDFTASAGFRAAVMADPGQTLPPRALIDFVANDAPVFPPGSQYRYSNTDNIVVGLMVEAATQRPYERELRDRVFRRVGLRETSLPATVEMPGPFIHGYEHGDDGELEDVSEILNPSLAWASGGIVSTPLDLNAFMRDYGGGRLTGSRVRAQQLDLVVGESDPPGPGTNRAGLAIFRYRTRCGDVYGHTGSFLGYTQFAAARGDGKRSATLSVSQQLEPGSDVLRAKREADELAVCAALADDDED